MIDKFHTMIVTAILIVLLILIGSIVARTFMPPVALDNTLEQVPLPNGWQQTYIVRNIGRAAIICVSFHSPKTHESMGYCTDNL